MFFHCAGLVAQGRYSHFEWANEEDAKKLDKIIEQFDKFGIPRGNQIVERYNFHKSVHSSQVSRSFSMLQPSVPWQPPASLV